MTFLFPICKQWAALPWSYSRIQVIDRSLTQCLRKNWLVLCSQIQG